MLIRLFLINNPQAELRRIPLIKVCERISSYPFATLCLLYIYTYVVRTQVV
jgi:hypothetical protein